MIGINRVTQVGNLTKDPELKTFGETTVCKMRVAVNDRVKVNGEWTDKPMYFDVDAFGRLGEMCAEYLKRGSRIMYEGKAKWREWTTDGGEKRQAVSFVAENVVFPTKRESDDAPQAQQQRTAAPAPPEQDFADDDIPF